MESKKEAIIFSALKLFGENGFSDVTIKEIAKEAKVSQVTIYNHFSNKEQLTEECTNILFDKIECLSDEILKEDISYPNKLNKVLMACNGEITKSISYYFNSKSLEDDKLMVVLDNAIRKRKNTIYLKYLELGYTMGYINPSIDKKSIITLMNAINHVSKTDLNGLNEDKFIEDVQQLFLFGIIGVEPKKQLQLENDTLLDLLADKIRERL